VTGSSLVSGKVCDRTLAAHADIAGYTGLIRVHADFKIQAKAEEDN
jgi:hypothetical protein